MGSNLQVNILIGSSLALATRFTILGLSIVFIGIFRCSTVLASSIPGIQLIAHRAIYQLSLMETANKSNWDSVAGRMVYELISPQCGGYTQNFRQILVLSGPQNGQRVLDNYSTSFESLEGNSLQFLSKEMAGEGAAEITSGNAKKSDDELSVHFNSPTQSEFNSKSEILFPVAYTIALIKKAIGKQHIYAALQFDGTDQGRPVQSSFAVIGDENSGAVGLEPILMDKNFEKLKRWPVSIGYSSHALKDSIESDYTVFEELFENGVAQSLVLDFKDFKLRGKLVDISFSEQNKCK